MISIFKSNLWTIVFALLMVMVAQFAAPVAIESWSANSAVVNFKYRVISQANLETVVTLSGEKMRACTFERIIAMARGRDGMMRDIYIQRIDKPSENLSRPIGKNYDVGVWKIWPIDGVLPNIYVQHNCNGVLVFSAVEQLKESV